MSRTKQKYHTEYTIKWPVLKKSTKSNYHIYCEAYKCQVSVQYRRKDVLDKYRNLGDFHHNVETLKKKSGIVIVGRRPTQDKIHKPNEYLLCQYCYVFFVSSEQWRHAKTCPFVQRPLKYENSKQEQVAAKDFMTAGQKLRISKEQQVMVHLDLIQV